MRQPRLRIKAIALCSIALLAIGGVPAAASAVKASGSTPATPINWAQNGFSKAGTFFNTYETTITPANVAAVQYRWSVVSPVVRPGDFNCSQLAAPIIDNGRMFVPDAAGFAVYDATTGTPEWSHHDNFTGGTDTDLLAATGSTVLDIETDCTSGGDPSSGLRAFNSATGAALWTAGAPDGTYTMVIDGTTLVATGTADGFIQTSAFSISTGALLWNVYNDGASASAAVSANGRMLLDTAPGSAAVNTTTGANVWTSATSYTAIAASFDGTHFIATDGSGHLDYINAATGAVNWSVAGMAGKVAVDASHIYVAHGNTLTSLSLATGAVVWNFPTTSPVGQPVEAGGVLYAAGGNGMWILNAATAAVVDSEDPYLPTDHVVVVNGKLYVTQGRVLDVLSP